MTTSRRGAVGSSPEGGVQARSGPADGSGRLVLSRGAHEPGTAFSISEAVAYAGGEAWTRHPRCMSPVINDWLLQWNDILEDGPRQDLCVYVERLSRSRGTPEDEAVRQWAVIDWTIRGLAPLWLDAATLPVQAQQLDRAAGITDQGTFGSVAASVDEAWAAAGRAQRGLNEVVARLAQPGPPGGVDQRRIETWGGLSDGVRGALQTQLTLLGPANAAAGIRHSRLDAAPPAWRAINELVLQAYEAVAWRAIHQLVIREEWSWTTPVGQAWETGFRVARAVLEPVEAATHALALKLLDHLLLITEGP